MFENVYIKQFFFNLDTIFNNFVGKLLSLLFIPQYVERIVYRDTVSVPRRSPLVILLSANAELFLPFY